MFELIGSIRRNRRLLKDFVVRDLKARYVGSSMGFFWSVVFPIINLFVYMFVFRMVLKARWSDFQGPYEVAIVMLAGIVVWTTFSETISRSTNTLVDNSNLIQKVVFPSELLPLYLTISSIINMCIGMPVVILCVLYFAYISPPDAELGAPYFAAEGPGAPADVVTEWAGAVAFPIRISRGMSHDVEVPFELSGTAMRGTDYRLEANSVRILPGQLQVAALLYPLANSDGEGEKTVVFTLLKPDGAVLGGTTVRTVRLVDGGLEAGAGTGAGAEFPAFAPGPMDASYHPLAMGWSLVCLPLLFVLQVLFTVGLGYFLSTFNLFLRDTFHLVGVGITVWMFGTPIFYPAQMVESAGFGWLLQINPMYWLIDSYRSVLLFAAWPDWWLLGRFALAGLVTFLVGGKFFMSQRRRFSDLL